MQLMQLRCADQEFLKPSPHMTQQDNKPITVHCTVQSAENQDYTIEQLEKILRVKRRQIFNYAKIICDLYQWESEETFRPSLGKFSLRMLAEMRRLQLAGADEYRLAVGREHHRPVAVKVHSSSLAVADCSGILDSRIANLQQSAITTSGNLADRLRDSLQKINQQRNLAVRQQSILSDAELLAAENQGYLEAIEIHQRRTAAKQSALAKLRAMELEE